MTAISLFFRHSYGIEMRPTLSHGTHVFRIRGRELARACDEALSAILTLADVLLEEQEN